MSQPQQAGTGPEIYVSYCNRQSAVAGGILTGSGALSIVFNVVALAMSEGSIFLCHGIYCGILVSKILTELYFITVYHWSRTDITSCKCITDGGTVSDTVTCTFKAISHWHELFAANYTFNQKEMCHFFI